MRFFKNLALSLLSFLLFLSLSIFSTAFMLNNTFLKPDFVVAEINRLDMASLAGDFVRFQAPGGEQAIEMETALVNTISDLEPLLKEQVSVAIYPIYDYLLGKSQHLDLALTLRNTVLSENFVIALIDKLDISSLVKEYLRSELTGNTLAGTGYLADYLDKYLEDVIAELKPWLKEQARTAAKPVADYLLGESQSLNVAISLEPIKESLREKLREALLESPPPELGLIPRAMRESLFNQFYQQLAEAIPATFELNEGMLGTRLPAQIAEALAEAETTLAQARQYVNYFQLGYRALIGFMILLVLGIILISRQVRDITRRLGVPCLTYGAVGYASIYIARYFTERQLQLPEIPASLQTWLSQFFENLLAPLATFSLGLLIGGVVLIIVSFVYKPRQA